MNSIELFIGMLVLLIGGFGSFMFMLMRLENHLTKLEAQISVFRAEMHRFCRDLDEALAEELQTARRDTAAQRQAAIVALSNAITAHRKENENP